MNSTPRLNLPFLSAGQAQKEIFHNEALQTLDVMVACCVEEPPRNDPPTAPATGAAYLVANTPTGAWAGKAGFVAAATSGGWRLIAPQEGMSAYVRSTGTLALFRGGGWEIGQVRGASMIVDGKQVIGPREAAIASAAGGATIDNQARSTIDQLLGALRRHGLIAT